jgi:hypothetical protein
VIEVPDFFGKMDRSVQAMPPIPTVQFDPSRVTKAVEAEVRATLRESSGLSAADLERAYDAALASIRSGRDMAVLSAALAALGLPKSRASDLAILVNNRATAVIGREHQTSLGITDAIWLYSGAPCRVDGAHASPEGAAQDAAHKAANGQRYRVAEGLLIGGQRVWPGQAAGCRCISKSVIPGFD